MTVDDGYGDKRTINQELESIEYRHGMLEAEMTPANRPVRTRRGAEIRKAIIEEDILNLGGVYGDKHVGDPPEYDYLRIELPDSVVEIESFNRGSTLFVTGDDRVKHIHRVPCKLEAR